MRIIHLMTIKNFVCDVDGCLTDGTFFYTVNGKHAKRFGPHDADGLKLLALNTDVMIQFITADKRGFEISHRRVARDMGYSLTLVAEAERYDFVKGLGFQETSFMGDGFFDAPILRDCGLGFAPKNARPEAKAAADIVTEHAGGDGAVMDACVYLLSYVGKMKS
jgi:3-deoxy-D-manno-octulosonate 8-phosphate phosphatase (KDO 8-P phosphatase)